MSDFISEFQSIIMQLFRMQADDVPNVLRHIISQILRFGTLAFCIAAVIFAVQSVIFIFDKKSRAKGYKNLIYTCVMFVITAAISVYAFLPLSAAPNKTVTSGAFQDIKYEQSLFENSEDNTEDTEQNTADDTQNDTEQSTAAGEGENTQETQADESSEEQDSNLVILSHTELSQEYTNKVLELLSNTDCTRTLMREIPKEDGQNLILRLENGDEWNIRLTPYMAYIFIEENVNFIYTVNDYAEFHAELANILQN